VRLKARSAFAASAEARAAQEAVSGTLRRLLEQLEPTVLGLYWPIRGEFSPGVQPFEALWPTGVPVALPFANKLAAPAGGTMVYRRWTPPEPAGRDPCGLPTADGPAVEPDVLLVPCLGYTETGYRLGYGGGYFDRYLAAHPGVTTVGVAWSASKLEEPPWQAEAHDQRLSLIVTELGVLAPL
jgi:5-formyltetrahydrofolate cyclo-ligase